MRNLSLVQRTIFVMSSHVDEAGNEESEEALILKGGESQELPFPLKILSGQEEDWWVLRDGEGTKTLLRLGFAVRT